jgi:O-succinylhomoserine sulfhydrylase
MTRKEYRTATKLVRGGVKRSANQETAEALYMTSGFVYSSAEEAAAAFRDEADVFVYSRYGNPTVKMFEDRLALLEGAESCRATGSGMAAVFGAMACQLEAGDRVVASRALFGACHAILTKILPRWGIQTELIDGTDLSAWEIALAEPAKLVLDLVDIKAVATLAHKAGALVMVDNVFASPLYQKPLALGADIVIYSTTKHIDGQGRLLGGAVLGKRSFVEDVFLPFYRQTGAAISAFNAWVMLKSLETLPLRVAAQSETAAKIADWLFQHPNIKKISYPGHASHPQHDLAKQQMSGFGSLLAFEVAGGEAAAFTVLNNLQLIDISNNLGDSKSLACHPYTTTHSNMSPEDRASLGISGGHIRLSVGLEDADDLIEDLDQALAFLGAR